MLHTQMCCQVFSNLVTLVKASAQISLPMQRYTGYHGSWVINTLRETLGKRLRLPELTLIFELVDTIA
jgi:hypothetical protein